MCEACWAIEYGEDGQDYGAGPSEWTPQTPRFIDLYRTLYGMENCGSGGPLHIVLDDWNIEDEHLTWCRENTCSDAGEYAGDHDPAARAVATQLLDIMDAWTIHQRASALAFEAGYLAPPT